MIIGLKKNNLYTKFKWSYWFSLLETLKVGLRFCPTTWYSCGVMRVVTRENHRRRYNACHNILSIATCKMLHWNLSSCYFAIHGKLAMYILSLSHTQTFLTPMQQKTFQNIVAKGQIAHRWEISPFASIILNLF